MYKIFNEDCLEGMKRLPDKSIDFILTDLPYNIMEYDRNKKPLDLNLLWQEFKRVLKPNCAVALFAAQRFTIKLAASNMDWYRYKWCWIKNTTCNFVNAKNRPLSKYEDVLIFSDGCVCHVSKSPNRMKYNPQGLKPCNIKHTDNHKKFAFAFGSRPSYERIYTQTQTGYPTDVLYFDAPPNAGRFHPNEKPVDLLEYLIKTYTNEGETVLDATMGSGSTGVACVNTSRRFIGFELDEKYFNLAQERIEKAIDSRKVLTVQNKGFVGPRPAKVQV